jgi:glutamyl-tRNA(Gln) amidotransferase subunit D
MVVLVNLQGYKNLAYNLLETAEVQIGDQVEVKTKKTKYRGVLMPRYEYADREHVVIKLSSGYNIGIKDKNIIRIEKIAENISTSFRKPKVSKLGKNLPKLIIIGTGGTIASRIDYRTGGVHPQFSVNDIYNAVPEISNFAQIETELLFNEFSEHINAEHWIKIIKKISGLMHEKVDGIIIAHGTDTMSYTSSALSFALSGTPIPIVLVGSQRSTDRPSSDASLNLIGAVVTAAQAPFSGVFVSMHSSINDDFISIHLGTRVRKNHTSRRDAFDSIGMSPVAYVKDGKLEVVNRDLPIRKKVLPFKSRYNFHKDVALIKFHPNIKTELIDYLVKSKYRGIIFEGTGLGHVSRDCFESISNAIKHEIIVGMTSQSIWGRINLEVYDTGRDLLKRGVIPLGDMLPETAFVKMMWALGNSKSCDDAKVLLLENIAGEYLHRTKIGEV